MIVPGVKPVSIGLSAGRAAQMIATLSSRLVQIDGSREAQVRSAAFSTKLMRTTRTIAASTTSQPSVIVASKTTFCRIGSLRHHIRGAAKAISQMSEATLQPNRIQKPMFWE